MFPMDCKKNYHSTKYHNKQITINGERFDSLKELSRYNQLLKLQDEGKISDLKRQVKFILIPAQREEETISPRGRLRPGKVIEREVAYWADFTYLLDGKMVVEDVKSPITRTEVYKVKRKLMLFIHGIRIREI